MKNVWDKEMFSCHGNNSFKKAFSLNFYQVELNR